MSRPEAMKLSERQIEELAVEVREFLLRCGMWHDVDIYFNDKRFSQTDPIDGKTYPNDREHLFVENGISPYEFIGSANSEHILSMAYDGSAYDMICRGSCPEIKREFDAIFEKYGLYYEFGDSCNFSCYYI